MRELAGASGRDALVWDLFVATLDELGIVVPSEQVALWRLAELKAAEIVDGRVSPIAGAVWIWTEVYRRLDNDCDLRVFVGLASEWEDHPGLRPEIDTSIVEAARKLASQDQPRS